MTSASVERVDVQGYCPHGGYLRVDEAGNDVNPHRYCSRYENYTYGVQLGPNSSYERAATVTPGEGVQDDLGHSLVLQRIAEQQVLLDESMHYPTQLRIRGRIASLHESRHLCRVYLLPLGCHVACECSTA